MGGEATSSGLVLPLSPSVITAEATVEWGGAGLIWVGGIAGTLWRWWGWGEKEETWAGRSTEPKPGQKLACRGGGGGGGSSGPDAAVVGGGEE